MKAGREVLIAVFLWSSSAQVWAGVPYRTDDPVPTDPGHAEFYLATVDLITIDQVVGTAPHVEVDLGALPDLQLHVLIPLVYNHMKGGPFFYGIGDLELGAKFRFLQEGNWHPMMATYPLLELPLGNSAKGLGAGSVRAFIPLWMQKEFGPWTVYGGGGWWLNPGKNNRHWWFTGLVVQREISPLATVGMEISYQTGDRRGTGSTALFDFGCLFNFGEHHHLPISLGRGIGGSVELIGFAAYLLTI